MRLPGFLATLNQGTRFTHTVLVRDRGNCREETTIQDFEEEKFFTIERSHALVHFQQCIFNSIKEAREAAKSQINYLLRTGFRDVSEATANALVLEKDPQANEISSILDRM